MTVYKYESTETTDDNRPCFCVGRQNDDPFCPCLMNRLKTIEGRQGKLARSVAEEIMHGS